MPERAAGDRVDGGAVGRAVVGDQPLDGDAVGWRSSATARRRNADRGGGLLVGEDLDVGQAGGVVDRDVHVLPADGLARDARRRRCGERCSALRLPVTRLPAPPLDPPELLDVDVDQLAGPLALVALRGLQARAGRACPSRSASGSPTPSRAAISSSSAISAPVIRNRRSAAIASIRRSSVRLATDRGAEERSSSPARPSAR